MYIYKFKPWDFCCHFRSGCVNLVVQACRESLVSVSAKQGCLLYLEYILQMCA